ncbi:hypothetical protein [Paenibacillus lemnae]|uniref:Uncharacterized protein n=1 Tax=Paenibacillus lemnae TaxID=1330551 RepID=A0A848M7I2_PAELE|nr:hypothetical protein [Paenibacillus lemnae]NMO96596.1 hypothetical protein [Paenibacillus lemnae]
MNNAAAKIFLSMVPPYFMRFQFYSKYALISASKAKDISAYSQTGEAPSTRMGASPLN